MRPSVRAHRRPADIDLDARRRRSSIRPATCSMPRAARSTRRTRPSASACRARTATPLPGDRPVHHRTGSGSSGSRSTPRHRGELALRESVPAEYLGLRDRQCQAKYDIVIWSWFGTSGLLLQIRSPTRSDVVGDSLWSNAATTSCTRAEQGGDDTSAKLIIDQMQQLFYDQAPYQMSTMTTSWTRTGRTGSPAGRPSRNGRGHANLRIQLSGSS